MNADGLIDVSRSIVMKNLFEYCSNSPVRLSDQNGDQAMVNDSELTAGFLISTMSIVYLKLDLGLIGKFVEQFVDTLTLTHTIGHSSQTLSQDETQSDTVTSSGVTSTEKPQVKKPVVFPSNPYDFNPNGLIRNYHIGTSNGPVITWDLGKNTIFRWDANTNAMNGPHYHIPGLVIPGVDPHYYAGSIIPEPYSTLYFGGQ